MTATTTKLDNKTLARIIARRKAIAKSKTKVDMAELYAMADKALLETEIIDFGIEINECFELYSDYEDYDHDNTWGMARFIATTLNDDHEVEADDYRRLIAYLYTLAPRVSEIDLSEENRPELDKIMNTTIDFEKFLINADYAAYCVRSNIRAVKKTMDPDKMIKLFVLAAIALSSTAD